MGIAGLFVFDREPTIRTSKALWIPVIWMTLAATASKWLQIGPRSMADQLDGNPIQRNIFLGLFVIGIVVLAARGRKVLALLSMNGPIVVFFLYGALSISWSDFPDVAFKRWIKALGDLVMVLIILTDPERTYAIKRFFARLGFLLIPVSILLIKYYPDLGMAYKMQDGRRVFEGVTNDKNMLGVVCLLAGLSAVWRLSLLLQEKAKRVSRKMLLAHGAVLVMVIWLLRYANSMTSLACLLFGASMVVLTGFPKLTRKRAVVHLLVLVILVIASLALFPYVGGNLVASLGRDPTLTGRTDLWSEIIDMNGNPMFGTGFESFWMGPRQEAIWNNHWWHPNEAHNGYIEVFLNLGWVGVILLIGVILNGYRHSLRMLWCEPEVGRLLLAFFVVGIVYSLPEAGFRLLNPVWICFMLASLAIPASPVPAILSAPNFLAPSAHQSSSRQDLELSGSRRAERFSPYARKS